MLDLFAGREGVAFWSGDQIHDWFVAQQPQPTHST
jgi:allantoinase